MLEHSEFIDGEFTKAQEPPACCCPRFTDTGGYRIADLACPVHGVNGTNPGDGMWDEEAVK